MDSPTVDRMAAFEARLRALEDERSIRELISSYCYYADSGRDEELAALFTVDGVMSSKVAGEERATVGLDQIRIQIADQNGHHRPDLYRRGLHLLGENVVVDVDGDQGTASSYSIMVLKRDSEYVIYSASSNRWLLRRVEGSWRIAERSRRALADDAFGEVLVDARSFTSLAGRAASGSEP